jgi:hypothetical protein
MGKDEKRDGWDLLRKNTLKSWRVETNTILKLRKLRKDIEWMMRVYDLRGVSGKGITGRDTILSGMILYEAV